MRFPRSVQFKVKPQALSRLAQQVSTRDDRPRPPREYTLVKWRSLLESTPQGVIDQWPFHPEWRRTLPYLTLPEEEGAIRNQAFKLFAKYISHFRLSKVIFIAENTLHPKLINYIRSSYQYASLPRWLQHADESGDLMSSACELAWRERGTLDETIAWLQVMLGTQAYELGWTSTVQRAPRHVVESEFNTWLSMVAKRSQSTPRCLAVFERLARFVDDAPESRNTQRWYDAGIKLIGGSISEFPGRWRELSRRAQAVALRVDQLRQRVNNAVFNFFTHWVSDRERSEYWQSKTSLITDFHLFESSTGAIMMKIGDRYFIEFGAKGNACYVYDEFEWDMIKRISQPRIGQLKLKNKWEDKTHWLPHRVGWQKVFDKYIQEYCLDE